VKEAPFVTITIILLLFVDPMLIYPNIVNMLGEMSLDINAMCLDRSQTYILMIEQRMTASCMVLNPSIARCTLPKIYDWGTKTVYFQPQTGKAMDEKAYVGYVYFGTVCSLN
jgi:hypothetical protein